jgi:hypothetical protein
MEVKPQYLIVCGIKTGLMKKRLFTSLSFCLMLSACDKGRSKPEIPDTGSYFYCKMDGKDWKPDLPMD